MNTCAFAKLTPVLNTSWFKKSKSTMDTRKSSFQSSFLQSCCESQKFQILLWCKQQLICTLPTVNWKAKLLEPWNCNFSNQDYNKKDDFTMIISKTIIHYSIVTKIANDQAHQPKIWTKKWSSEYLLKANFNASQRVCII